jgi:fatty-acyl-CoA synthase
VVLTEGAALTAEEVRALARARLATFCVPRDVVFLDELPRGATGKVVPRLLPPSTGTAQASGANRPGAT